MKKQVNVMLNKTYPRFLPFYYFLGSNLGSLLHGYVSVINLFTQHSRYFNVIVYSE